MSRLYLSQSILLTSAVFGGLWFLRYLKNRSKTKIIYHPVKVKKLFLDQVIIFYASQRGTSEELARQLKEELEVRDVPSTVVDLDDFTENLLEARYCIFLLSSYGEGDPPDNGENFFDWLQDGDKIFDNEIAIFGLGSSLYLDFNGFAKKCEKHLSRIGCRQICESGFGDDDGDLSSDFKEWKEKLFEALKTISFSVKKQEKTRENVIQSLSIQCQIEKNLEDLKHDVRVQGVGQTVLSRSLFSLHELRVGKKRIFENVVYLEFDLTDRPQLSYRTCDTLEILPKNSDAEVSFFLEVLKVPKSILNSHVGFLSKGNFVKKLFPVPSTVQVVFEEFLDLTSIPGRHALQNLAQFLDSSEKIFLLQLLENVERMKKLRYELNFCEFVFLFMNSLDIEIELFLLLCPLQKTRLYTTATSSKKTPKQVGVLLSLLEKSSTQDETKMISLDLESHPEKFVDFFERKKEGAFKKLGTCSSFLHRVEVDERVRLGVRVSSFRLKRETTPVVMIASGTGVAPFKAFVEELQHPRVAVLYFGFRGEQEFLFKEVFQQAVESRVLEKLVECRSREGEKIYVQEGVRRDLEFIKKLLDQKATVYVCGKTDMGRQIQEILLNEVGRPKFEKMQRERRYVEELYDS